MKKYPAVIICLSLLIACDKKNDDIVIDDPVIVQFGLDTIAIDTISGYIFQNCAGTPAANELINIGRMGESFGIYINETDSFYTDANGYFEYVWTVLEGDESGANNVSLMGFIPSVGQTIFFDSYDVGNQYAEFSLTDSIHIKIEFSFLSPHTGLDTLWYDKYYGALFGGASASYFTGPFSDTSVYLPVYATACDLYSQGQFKNYIDYGIGFDEFYQTHITFPDPHKIEYFHGYCTALDSVSIVVE